MELKTVTEGSEGKERTLEDFTVHGVTVPAGFLFDGASAPRIFWAIIPPFFKTKKAAVIHDWLCKNAKDSLDRWAADRLFYGMILEAGLGKTRAKIGYWGVRLGAMMGIGVHYKR